MHYSERPNGSDWRDSSFVWLAIFIGYLLAKLVAPSAIVVFIILRWLDGEGFPVPWRFFIWGLIIFVILVIGAGIKTWSEDGGYETQCDHIGVRNGKPCIRRYGHLGQHRYRLASTSM